MSFFNSHETPKIPQAVNWIDGLVLEPLHFTRTDDRSASLAHFSALMADPWPWGFRSITLDETSLAGGELRIECDGIFPDGKPFARTRLTITLPQEDDEQSIHYHLVRGAENETLVLRSGGDAAAEKSLPAARLKRYGGVWNQIEGWSPPALLIGPDHPLRFDLNKHLGAMAALGVGFGATLRLPGAENRPAARVLGQVATVVAQGVGVIQAMLDSPTVTPGRIGLEALRLALGTRAAAGIFEPLPGNNWSPIDQRGSLRILFKEAEIAASGIGLPFRSAVFSLSETPGVLEVKVPSGSLLLAIESQQPANLIAARNWFDGAALAAPDRIQSALTRRVSGCQRRSITRDATMGVASGPLLALYQVDDDLAWRAGHPLLALSAESPPPEGTSFSILIPMNANEPTGLLESPDVTTNNISRKWR
ncbi:MAG: type VI secretion system baseplate subunit TssK [Aestuariivita sp.]|nr:type VI secretion system baseplate subunit TssK [Aestuariivita sp.]